MHLRSLVPWVLVPALAATVMAAAVDPWSPPLIGRERISAVLLLDGQAYFGHVTDLPWSDTVEVRDVYYFRDARGTTTNLPLGLQRRGGELHRPSGAMTVRRDKIIAIEDLQPSSGVIIAIATERALLAPEAP